MAVAFAASVLVWLAYVNIVPLGVYKVIWKAGMISARVTPLVPESRVSEVKIASDGTPYRTITNEPINFDVKIPRNFDTAEVSVKFNGNEKIFEIGGLASRQTWTSEMLPAENSVIDGLKWTRVAGDGLFLYERNPVFKTISAFLSAMPTEGVAVYRASGFPSAPPENYRSSSTDKKYQVAFRGATTIKTYLKNEKLDFLFKTQDVNRGAGADGFTATATLDGNEIARAIFADDNDTSSSGKFSPLRDLRLYTDLPLTGIVTISLPAPDDVIFRETITAQTKFIFANRIYLADNTGYAKSPSAATVVTDGKKVSATTSHATSFQTVKIGTTNLAVNDLNTPFVSLINYKEEKTVPIVSALGDLRLETAGFFAFSSDNYWRPDPPQLTSESDLLKDGINYILTSYVPPLHSGLWRLATVTYDFNRLAKFGRSVNFVLSLPGKNSADIFNVAEIDVTFKRQPLEWRDLGAVWDKIVKTVSSIKL